METRSKARYEKSAKYEVDIDFDAASEAWKANKKSIGNGSYKYVCCKKNKNDDYCNKKCLPFEDYCTIHLKMYNDGKF